MSPLSTKGDWRISKDLLETKAELKEEALVISKVDSGDTAPYLPYLTPEWLKSNAVASIQKHDGSFADAAPNQRDLFIKSFNDPALIHKAVQGLFNFGRFDDYPSLMITVIFTDGSRISARSITTQPLEDGEHCHHQIKP